MLGEVISLSTWWQRLSTRGKVVAGASRRAAVRGGRGRLHGQQRRPGALRPRRTPRRSYVMVFVLIALDAVMPIFPGETTLNAAATLAAQGKLDLLPIIVMGALGAIVGDSALFWIARKFSRQAPGAAHPGQGQQAGQAGLRAASTRAPPVLIIGGRYLPGMRFVVNATMGLSDIPYRRFLLWSVISGILWSTYTSVLAYEIGLALGDYPARLVHHLGARDHRRARRRDLHRPTQRRRRRCGRHHQP